MRVSIVRDGSDVSSVSLYCPAKRLPLFVSGTRTDDGSVFTTGQTDVMDTTEDAKADTKNEYTDLVEAPDSGNVIEASGR